jgi:small conductance mechanosensitive channel
VLAVLAALVLVLWVVDWLLARKGRQWAERLAPGERVVLETRYRLLRRVILAILFVVAVAVALIAASPRTRAAAQAVLASSAVLGLVVGFAARTTLANFVAGIMIAINQPVRLDDRVSLGDADGTVEDIGLTYTRLRTSDNRRVLIPNEQLVNSTLTNHTLIDPESLAQVRVSASLDAPPARVLELLREEARGAPGRLPDREPEASVAELGPDAAVYSVAVWTPTAAEAGAAAAWLRERVLERLGEAGVLPQDAEATEVAR